MSDSVGYKVIRDIDYTKSLRDCGDLPPQRVHIVSKTCLDLFLPTPKSDTRKCSRCHGDDDTKAPETISNGYISYQEASKLASHLHIHHRQRQLHHREGAAADDSSPEFEGRRSEEEVSNLLQVQTALEAGSSSSSSAESPSALVVFAYGGGWRRGDKQTWRHYLSRWDVNFALAATVGRQRFYDNVGESFASRGMHCAVLSYPLVPTPFPINIVEIVSSFLMTVIFTIAMVTLLLIGVDVVSMPAFSFSVSYLIWNSIQHYLDHPFLTLASTVMLLSQLLTLSVIIWRERHLGTKGSPCANVPGNHNILSGWYYTILGLGVSFPPLVLGITRYVYAEVCIITLSACLTAFVQFLTYRYQASTIRQSREEGGGSCMSADSAETQAKCIARSLRWLADYGQSSGQFDPTSIVLVGHSAGGHLMSLVALDNRYLSSVGLPQDIIKGVITLSAVHDLDSLTQGLKRHVYLTPAFGTNPADWIRLSPITYATTTAHKPRFLIMSAERDFQFMIADSAKMHDVLASNGFEVQWKYLDNCNHLSMVSKFGRPWYYFLGRGKRGWSPSDGEKLCWDFVESIMLGG
ncbi:uncharacterized protein [Diadema antillarum]|uniref:uncharacterized protein n=1 Tax=Diadema antillarum TaxID=105358 RepID=UPI003A89E685